jgi:hypothetical protein
MIRRKSEIVRLKNERDFPHLVETNACGSGRYALRKPFRF